VSDKNLSRVLEVIESLLGPGGCPWDQKQTPATLCDYVVEEAFELAEAIRSGDSTEIMEELGDLFFLLLFISVLHEKTGRFTLDRVFKANAEKMIRRHPHVFGETRIESREELLKNWERIKKKEKAENGRPKGVYDSLPESLPPLLKAYRIHSKAARQGFTWADDKDLESKLAEEWEEWREAEKSGDRAVMEREFGDLIFTLVELGRRREIKANAALALANRKFLTRFEKMESLARETGKDLAEMSLQEMDELWNRAKENETPGP